MNNTSKAHVAHRGWLYGFKEMMYCVGCGNWSKRTLPARCTSNHCYKKNELMEIVKSEYNQEEEDKLELISLCRVCDKQFLECNCDWKKRMLKKREEYERMLRLAKVRYN